MAITILSVALLITLVTTYTSAWIALKDPHEELRKSALTVLVDIIGTLIGAIAGLGGGKLLGVEDEKGNE